MTTIGGPQTAKPLPNIMKWVQIYLVCTVLLYLVGPIHYVKYNTALVLMLIATYQFFLWLGYKYGVSKKRSLSRDGQIQSARVFTGKDQKLINTIAFIGIFFDILMMYRMSNTWNPAAIFGKIVNGLTSPASQYQEYYADHAAGNLGGGALFSLLITLGTPFSIAAIVLGLFYFPRMRLSGKVIFLACSLIHLGTQFITGANEGIFDFAIYVAVTLFMRSINLNLTERTSVVATGAKKIAVIILAVLAAILALSFFTSNVMGRTKGNFAFATLGENRYDANAGINKYIPEPLFVTFAYLSVYLCEGYYGFSLTTKLPWVPTFGTGFSSFIRNNIAELFGVDLFQYTYQVRIEEIAQWGSLRNFHTAYTFWANDLSHIGVPIAMFLMGMVLGKYYKKCVYTCNKLSIVMMPIMITMMFYLPANNKIFVQPSTFLLFFFIVIHDALEGKVRFTFKRR
ncbi:MAG: hypothetical protein IJU28_05960 [Clostridia bacterium]|nr:hypothetical protein [Clostridia bacterium]